MKLLKATNLLLMGLAAGLLAYWTHYEAAVNNLGYQEKPFHRFLLVWGGTVLVALLRGVKVERSISGRIRLSYAFQIKPYTLCLAAFCCGFTLHALAASTPEFDVEHLNMPFFLPYLFLPLHFCLVGWLFLKEGESEADRGLMVLLIFHALNGAVFDTEYYVIAGLALITFLEGLIENRGRLTLPPLFITLPLVVLLGFVALSGWKAINPIKSTQAISHVSVCAVVLVLVAGRPRGGAFMMKLIGITVFASGIVIASVAIMISLVGTILGPLPIVSTRLTLFYQHPNFLAPYFATFAILSMTLVLCVRRWWMRVALTGFSLLLVAALGLTDSRAGFLGFIAAFFVILVIMSPLLSWTARRFYAISASTRRWMLAGGAGVVVLSILILALYGGKILETVRQSARLQRAQDYRMDAWSNSLEIIKDNKLHGIGLDTFISVKKFAPGSKFSHEKEAPHPHNLFLYVAQGCGLPALAAFLVLLGGYLYGSLKVIRRTDHPLEKKLIKGCLAASTALLTCGVLDLGLSLLTLFPSPLWLFIGMVAALCNALPGQRVRAIEVTGATALIPSAALAAAVVYGAALPLTGRILLYRAFLSESTEGVKRTIALGEQALAYYPYLRGAREFLLKRLIREKAFDRAYGMVTTASGLEPENAWLHLNLGNLLSMGQDPERAIAEYEKAVAVDHGSDNLPQYYAKLINATVAIGPRERVEELLKTAIRRNIAVINLIGWKILPHPEGRDDQYLEIGGPGEVLRLEEVLDALYETLLNDYAAGLPQDRFDWFSLYQAFFNAFVYDRALAMLDDIEQIFGEREKATVQHHRAEIAKRKGAVTESEGLLKEAEAVGDPTNPTALAHYQSKKAEVLLSQGKLDEAITLQKETLHGLRDYRNFTSSFVLTLDILLAAYQEKGERQAMIEPLIQRIFFCRDRYEQLPYLLDLAACYKDTGRSGMAEKTILRALDWFAATHKGMYQFEDHAARERVQRIAYLLAELYAAMGVEGNAAQQRVWRATKFFSTNPARILFGSHFLIRAGLPHRAACLLDLSLMDEPENLIFLELKIECCQLSDDLDGLHDTNHRIKDAYIAKGVDLEARSKMLLATAYQDRQNVAAILELARVLSYEYKFDQTLNILQEGLRLHPMESRFQWLAARVYRMDDKTEAAAEALERALEADPSNFKAAQTLEALKGKMHRNSKGHPKEGS